MAEFFFVRQSLLYSGRGGMSSAPAWQPAVDLYRCADGWLLKFELAGVRVEDIAIRLDQGGVALSGVRRDVRELDEQEPHLMEIAYSRFERFVVLPDALDEMEMTADFRDGMLYVRVRRHEPNMRRGDVHLT